MPQIQRLLAAMQARSFDLGGTLFHPDFFGDTPSGRASSQGQEKNGLSWQIFAAGEQSGAKVFAEQWRRHLAEFTAIDRTEFQVSSVSSPDEISTEVYIHYRLTGDASGSRMEDQGEMLALFRRDSRTSASWRIKNLTLVELERFTTEPQFEDITTSLGLPPLNASPDTHYVSYFAQGVSLADTDGDDLLDIFVPRPGAAPILYRKDRSDSYNNVTAEAGLQRLNDVRSGYFFDWDNDDDLDLLALTSQGLHLLKNDNGEFFEVSELSGFDQVKTTGLIGAAIADFDNDGLLDFFLCNYGNPVNAPGFDYFDSRRGFSNKLFRNVGNGKFEDATREAGLAEGNNRWSYAAIWLDYDADQKMDLYVVNDFGANQLFRNIDGFKFVDVAGHSGVLDPGNGMGVSSADFDNDGLIDIYVSNMHSKTGKRILNSTDYGGTANQRDLALRFAKGNTLLRNLGDGVFQEVPDSPVLNGKWSWGNRFFDYDNDGDQDIYVANGMFSNSNRKDVDPVYWRHVLAPASRLDPVFQLGARHMDDRMRTSAESFAGYEHNRFFQNTGAGGFVDVGAVLGIDLVQDSRGVASGDLDGDGDLDLVVSNKNNPLITVFENRVRDLGNYLAIKTVGVQSNRQGIGTKLAVTCGGATQVQVVQLGTGFVSQSDQTAWFGLGECDEVESVRLTWPSGAEQVLGPFRGNQKIEVIELDLAG